MSLGREESGGAPPDLDKDEEREVAPPARPGEYVWADFFAEFDPDAREVPADPNADDPATRLGWETSIDLVGLLGRPPEDLEDAIDTARERARTLDAMTYDTFDPEETPVRQGEWSWHHFVRACVDPEWNETTLPESFESEEHLGFPEEELPGRFAAGAVAAEALEELVEERTVDVNPEVDESSFFRAADGSSTIVTRYDLEKAVPMEKKRHFRELERYWVHKPYAFVSIFRSERENETKYYLIEPYQTPIEADLFEFLTDKLRTAIKYTDELVLEGGADDRRQVLQEETLALLERYDIYEPAKEPSDGGSRFDVLGRLGGLFGEEDEDDGRIEGIAARPEPALLEEDASTLTEYQVEKLLYRLRRNFLGYERIDGIKHDINVEDISCDGYESPVFVYHSSYEQIISNVYHGTERLDDFVIKLAQRSGKGISKRQPQVDATLPDGSRAQLTLGREVSDHGTNYTIRQFNDVPFTPIDLINWRTFSLEEMAFLWLCIENHKSLIFAGGTASGKTTSLNAVSLFIPSTSKIVSIEDTREVELPQRNWIASVTRPSFSDDSKGEVDEFDLLEAALRQRPEYIVMGEIRGEEGRTLFQVMSTGHTTYTTFHADSVGEVLKRFTTDPINVSKTMFTALDLVSIQTSTRVRGRKVRRNKSITEINHYDTENDEINVRDIYQWQAETDEFLKLGSSSTLDDILFDRGWDRERLDEEIFKREVVLAYLIHNGLNEYQQVAATLQAFISDPDTIFALIANGTLGESLEDLREMESVLINVDPEKEELVPRPDPDEEMQEQVASILERAEEELFPEYYAEETGSVGEVLRETQPAGDITAEPGAGADLTVDAEEEHEEHEPAHDEAAEEDFEAIAPGHDEDDPGPEEQPPGIEPVDDESPTTEPEDVEELSRAEFEPRADDASEGIGDSEPPETTASADETSDSYGQETPGTFEDTPEEPTSTLQGQESTDDLFDLREGRDTDGFGMSPAEEDASSQDDEQAGSREHSRPSEDDPSDPNGNGTPGMFEDTSEEMPSTPQATESNEDRFGLEEDGQADGFGMAPVDGEASASRAEEDAFRDAPKANDDEVSDPFAEDTSPGFGETANARRDADDDLSGDDDARNEASGHMVEFDKPVDGTFEEESSPLRAEDSTEDRFDHREEREENGFGMPTEDREESPGRDEEH